MNEDVANPSGKFWSPLYIGVIAFLCLLLPGFFLLGVNYRKLGKPHLKWISWIVGILVFGVFASWFVDSWPHLDWLFMLLYIGTSVAMAAIQYSLYRRVLDDDETVRPQSLLVPGVLSALFAIGVLILFFGWEWYSYTGYVKRLQQAEEFYDAGEYPAAIAVMKETCADYPTGRESYVMLAMLYDASGKRDSAIFALDSWLGVAPEDAEVKEKLYDLRYKKGSE